MKKINIIILSLFLLFLITGCKNKNQQTVVVDSQFETGYSDVVINKDTLTASKGEVFGFYKDASFKEALDQNQIKSAEKVFVKLLVGSGTEADPYLIGSANALNSLTHLGKEITGFVKITNDFTTYSEYTADYEKTTFNGTLDGGSHNIFFDEENTLSDTGLFYKIGSSGIVSNLNLHGPIEASHASTGALCNYNMGKIKNVRTYGTSFHASNGANNGVALMTVWDDENQNVLIDHGTVGLLETLSKGGAGGIAGTNNGEIEACVNSMNVKATIGAGGIAGINNGEIHNCFNVGAIGTTGNNSVNSTTIRDHQFDFSYLGGITGVNYGIVRQCVNSNQVFVARLPWKFGDAPAGQSDYIDRIRIGGIVGANFGTFNEESGQYEKGIIEECANYGRVHGDMQVGGIVGYTSGLVANCEVISPIGARSCLGGIAGWQSGDKDGDRIAVVTNCLAITRVVAGSAQSVVDEAGNQYTAVKLIQKSSSVSSSNIDEYYHIAKYATNCVYHNYGGDTKPIDPTTGSEDENSTTTPATMKSSVRSIVAFNDEVDNGKWSAFLDTPTENNDVTAIVGFNSSWQAFLCLYLAFQAKTITYVVDGEETTIKGVAGINYLTTVVTKSSGTWVSGLASNYSAAIQERALPINPITVGENQEFVWLTDPNNPDSVWDGLLTCDIKIYASTRPRG